MYAKARTDEQMDEALWRLYVADGIRAAAQGQYQQERYADLVERLHEPPRPVETVEEILAHLSAEGLEVI